MVSICANVSCEAEEPVLDLLLETVVKRADHV